VAMKCVLFPLCDFHFEVSRSVICLAVSFSARDTENERQGREKCFILRHCDVLILYSVVGRLVKYECAALVE
jgi:hypothetical protein